MTAPEELSNMDVVTDQATERATRLRPATDVDRAVQAADAAARAAGVSVRDLVELADLEQVVELFSDIWGRSSNPPVTLELLRAFTKAGNYVGGAVRGRAAGRRLRRVLPRAGRGRAAQPHRRGRRPPAAASGSPSSSTSVRGPSCTGCPRSPGPSTR